MCVKPSDIKCHSVAALFSSSESSLLLVISTFTVLKIKIQHLLTSIVMYKKKQVSFLLKSAQMCSGLKSKEPPSLVP